MKVMADEGSIDLLSGRFLRGELAELEQKMLLEVFSKYVSHVDGMVNDGKEATVYRCLGHDNEYYAAKVYRDRRFRAFANESSYLDAASIGDRRLTKAIRKRTKIGRRTSQHLWINREWQALNMLYEAGASVPEPLDKAPDAILMELVGSEGAAAPMLAQLKLDKTAAEKAFKAILLDIEKLLDCELIHGDLSAYNILYHNCRPRLIDLPQVLDIHGAGDNFAPFLRDIENIATFFERQGLTVDALDISIKLWRRYV